MIANATPKRRPMIGRKNNHRKAAHANIDLKAKTAVGRYDRLKTGPSTASTRSPFARVDQPISAAVRTSWPGSGFRKARGMF
jgi:hypothetical protein